jgi:predicted RND superfamily exporter protein
MHLPLETDLRATLPEDIALALEHRNRLFEMHDLALLLVQTEDKAQEDLIAFGEALTRRLTASPLIRRVEFGYSPALLNMLNNVALDYAPLFVSPEQLEDFEQLLTPQGLKMQLSKTLLQLNTISSSVRDLALQDDPLQVRRFAFARFATLRGSFQFDAFSPYFLSKDGKALLIKVQGQALVDDMARARATVRLLRQVAQELLALPSFQGLTVHGTGSYFFATESESTIRRDLIRSISLAVILICLLIAWAFRRWGVLVYGQIPTLVGLFIALGVFALLRPTLNSLTLGCSAALVGLGIDFTIHILTQCFDELGKGKTTLEAIQTSVRETGSGLLLAATTTIAAFTAFLFSTQRFLQDMGLLAVLGIFFCLLLCLMLLPSLVACLPGKGGQPRPRAMGIPQVISLTLKAPLLILGLSLALCGGAVAALTLWPPGFETDLRNIYAADSPALQTQGKIAAIFGGSQAPVTLMIEGSTEEQVLQTMQRLEPALQSMVGEGVLAAMTSLSTLVPAAKDQQAMLHLLRNTNPTAFAKLLTTSLDEAGFDVNALQSYITRIHNALTLKTPLDLSTLKTLGFGELLRSFLSHDGAEAAGLVMLFPKRDLWTLEASTAFSRRISTLLTELGLHDTVTDLYTLSPDATAQIGKDFRNITLLALVFIGTAICLQFRKPLVIGLVFLPVVCGSLWTAGILALCGWKLNFMNIAILPMLLGIGIDDGIHIVHRFHTHGSRDVQAALQFTGTAVFLTSLTTMLAFGSLVLSATQGIVSVGLISLIGVTACLLASLFTLPAALHVWGRKRNHDTRAVDPCN